MWNKKTKTLLLCLLAFTAFLILEKHTCFMLDGNDDGVFASQITSMGLFNWLKAFYLGWSGRIFLTAIDGLIINTSIWLWRVLNALVFTQLIYFVYRIVDDHLLVLVFGSLYFLIYPNTLANCNFWVTGSFNYLWPASFMLVMIYLALKVLNREELSRSEIIYGIVAALFCGNQEQTGLIALCVLFAAIAYRFFMDKKLNTKALGGFVFLLVIYLVTMLAPGNSVRSASEIIQLNVAFKTYSIFDKIFGGLTLCLNHLYQKYKILIALLCLLVVACDYRKPANYLPLILFGSALVLKNYLFSKGLFFEDYEVSVSYEPTFWLLVLYRAGMLLSLLYRMIACVDKDKDKITLLLVLSLSIVIATIMGFSPTIYGSGNRVFYCTALLIDLAAILLLKKSGLYKKWPIILIIVLVLAYCDRNTVMMFLADNAYLYLY